MKATFFFDIYLVSFDVKYEKIPMGLWEKGCGGFTKNSFAFFVHPIILLYLVIIFWDIVICVAHDNSSSVARVVHAHTF